VTGAHQKAGSDTPRHVLVVEDELLIRWSIAETLANAGCLVTEAPDGATALRVLSEADGSIDVVVLDYRLPDSNDLTLLRRIRQLSPHSAVLMMTAFGSPEIIKQALGLGVSRVIQKPFEMDDLEALIVEASASRPTSVNPAES
jgi:DNA-binding NtrC family response regulator